MKFFIFILLNIFVTTLLKSSELDSIIKVDSNRYSDYIINKITIKGNNITKDEVILRELHLFTGSKYDSLLYNEDLNNLNNLNIFNRVKLYFNQDFSNKSLEYIIEVEESPNILPVPQGGMKEGSIKKIWAGINFQWKNFRGMNETLGLNFGIGYEPFVSLFYYNPWIGMKEHFFTKMSFTFNKNVNKIFLDTSNFFKDNALEYYIFRYIPELSIGKYLSKYFRISANVSYNIYMISSPEIISSLLKRKSEKYTRLSFSLNYDKRNDINYTTHGTYLDFSYNRLGIFSERIQFNKIELNIKKFIPIRVIKDYFVSYSIWIRLANIFGNKPPDYLLEVYGYDLYVRGWKEYLFKGENSLGIFSEFRIPVIKPFYVDGKKHFIIKSIPYFRNFSYEYGLFLTTFFDIGTVYNRNINISNLSFKNGYGIGLNLLLPFNFIVRVDFALNKDIEKFKSRFSFDLNPSF
ncbi:MAG: BamA/TamA family outer membrane protein [Ignavibacteria bacterium]|nr:BamA/TamA family outer membrane protein [Ignavibacteria bacterium]